MPDFTTKYKRFNAISTALFVIAFLVLGFILNRSFLRGYVELDKADLIDNAARVQRTFQERFLDLESKMSDWGAWDEAFSYINSRQKSFETANFTDTVLGGMKVTLVAYLNPELELISARHLDRDLQKIVEVTPHQLKFLAKDSILVSKSDKAAFSGLILFHHQPAIVAAKKVSKGDGSGPPAGRVIFARIIDNELIKSLSEQTRLDIQYEENADPTLTSQAADSLTIPGGKLQILYDYADAHLALTDISGENIGYLKVKIDRTIMKIGRANSVDFLALYAILSSAIIACAIFALKRVESKKLLLRTIEEGKIVRESQLQMQALIDSIPGYVSWYDDSLKYLGVNRKLAADCHLHPTDFIGKECGFLTGARSLNFKENLKEFFLDEGTRSKQFEMYVDDTSGKRKFNISMEKYFGNKRVIVVSIDLTHSWRLEQQSLQDRQIAINAARLSSLGQMAGGIAHEINNPLAIIQGACERLEKKLKAGAALDDLPMTLRVIDRTTKRIASIIAGLKLVARDDSNDPKVDVSVKSIVDNTYGICAEKFKSSGVQFFISDISQNLTMHCRPTQIGQVMINLLNNAFDAIESREKPWIRVEILDQQSHIEISVIDSGNGVTPELAEKIMDPFFTTKPVGKGIGLGLSVSTAIIESHGGTLNLDLSCHNTCFVMRIPKAIT